MIENGKEEKFKKKYQKKILEIDSNSVFDIFFSWHNTKQGFYTSFSLRGIGVNDNSHSIPVSEEWNLIVVNRWNEIPEDFFISLTELSNGQSVDSRIYPYLQEMFDVAREDNIYPIVREGYRTTEEQGEIFNEKVQAYINEGYSKARAEKTAKEWDAVPGTSEHQLGIAVDINADKTQSTNDEVYVWLADLGRILRTFKIKKNVEVIDNGKDDF